MLSSLYMTLYLFVAYPDLSILSSILSPSAWHTGLEPYHYDALCLIRGNPGQWSTRQAVS